MASRKRSIREVSSLSGETEISESSISNDKVEQMAESSGDSKHPSKRLHTESPRPAASASSEKVQQAGLKILLEAERVTTPQSYISSISHNNRNNNIAAASQSLPFLVPAQLGAHQAWSEQTAKWCYDVLDHLQLPREIVYLSMNLLEKALLAGGSGTSSTNQHHYEPFEITNKHEYEKMAIASLFLAVRLVSTRQSKSKTASAAAAPRRKLQISELLTISGSSWTIQDIQQSSSKILQVLGLYHQGHNSVSKAWNFELHQALVQATPHAFCKLLFFGFHKKKDQGAKHEALPRQTRLEWLELALYLIELSVCDGGFHRLFPSVIALSSLQTAAKILQSKEQESSKSAFQRSQHVIEETLREAYGVSQLPNTTFVGNRLEYIYQQSQDNRAFRARGTRRRNTRASSNTASHACAFTCPTLIVDDDDEEEVEEPEELGFSIAPRQYNQDTTAALQEQPKPAAATLNKNPQGSVIQHHPMRHIQSDLDLEALGRQHETLMHRPISPQP
jgi:hypothetical protein